MKQNSPEFPKIPSPNSRLSWSRSRMYDNITPITFCQSKDQHHSLEKVYFYFRIFLTKFIYNAWQKILCLRMSRRDRQSAFLLFGQIAREAANIFYLAQNSASPCNHFVASRRNCRPRRMGGHDHPRRLGRPRQHFPTSVGLTVREPTSRAPSNHPY